MVNVDDLTHLDASDIEAIHDSILEHYPGLPGSKPGMSAGRLSGAFSPISTIDTSLA